MACAPPDIPWEIGLPGRYVILGIVHDNSDHARPHYRPELLKGFDLPLAFSVCRDCGAGSDTGEMGFADFDRDSIERALIDVKADLASHLAQTGGGAGTGSKAIGERKAPPPLTPDAAAPGQPARRKGYAMSNESTRKAADLRKVAEALRAWGRFQGANSPEALEATRTALDLATRHFDIITESNNRWGHFGGATCALEKLSEITAERGRVDFGKYSGWWSHFTTPYVRLDGGLPDALERWAEELDKAGAVAGALAGPEAPATVTPDAAAVRAGGKAAAGKEATALALLVRNPDWSNRKIADEVPCHVKSLSRMKRFKQARQTLSEQGKGELPKGSKYRKTDAEQSNMEARDADENV